MVFTLCADKNVVSGHIVVWYIYMYLVYNPYMRFTAWSLMPYPCLPLLDLHWSA